MRLAGLCCVHVCLLTVAALASQPVNNKIALADRFSKAPLHFEPNVGQAPGEFKYIARSGKGLFLFGNDQTILRIWDSKSTAPESLRLRLSGSHPAKPAGVDSLVSHSNYFLGSDPSKWRKDVDNFGKVSYQGVYPGIDVVYYGNQREVEYDFVVAPGADPSQVKVNFTGQKSLSLDGKGGLVIGFGNRAIRQTEPIAYQNTASGRRYVAAQYKINGSDVSFRLGAYDHRQPLIIDPTITYSRFIGGTGPETADGIAVDAAGNAYVTGYTLSTNFPTVNAYDSTLGGTGQNAIDAFVVKLDPTGSTVLYSTYIGGASTDLAHAIAVDSNGNAYITGETQSTDYPVVNALRTTKSGGVDAIVTKLNPTGNALVYSTYMGGSLLDSGLAIAVDSTGAAYIGGSTFSLNFLGLVNFNDHEQDGFVVKLTPAGNVVVFGGYIGDTGSDIIQAIAVDVAGNMIIAGTTNSTTLQGNGVQQFYGGGAADGFIATYNAAGTFQKLTFVGGPGDDGIHGLATDAARNIYFVADTNSSSILSANLTAPSTAGAGDVLVGKFPPSLASYTYLRYLGGSSFEQSGGIAVDSTGAAYVTGLTQSANFPVVNGLSDRPGSYDAFVTKVAPDGNSLIYSTYLGGTQAEFGRAIAVNAAGDAFVTGYTLSPDFPRTVAGNVLNSSQDIFITKLSSCNITVNPAVEALNSQAATRTISLTTTPGCTWTISTTANFITLNGPTSGSGNGSFSYSVPANNGAQRSATIDISGIKLPVSQTGGVAVAPQVVGVTPTTGTGLTQTFTATFSDGNGGADIATAYFLAASAIAPNNVCFIEYNRAGNSFRVLGNDGATYSAAVPAGSGSAGNSQCTFSGVGAQGVVSGSNLTISFPVTFAESYGGAKNVYLLAIDSVGGNSNWQQAGTFTIQNPNIPQVPSVVSFSPLVGGGQSGTFTAVFRHPGGVNKHYLGYVLFLPTPNVVSYTAQGSCLIEYNRISNGVRLIDDAGTGWLGPLSGVPISPTAGSLTNSQCSVNVANVVPTLAGTDMTVQIPVTFNPNFTGILGTFLQENDVNDNTTGITQYGNWLVSLPPTPKPGPAVVAGDPPNGSGSSRTFTLTAGHTSGTSNLNIITLLIASSIVGGSPCQAFYFPLTNTLNLVNDSGTAMVSQTGNAPGTGGVLANSRCSLNTAASTKSVSGNNLTVTFPMGFAATGFTGVKSVYGNVFDIYGTLSHWVQIGYFSVP